MDLKFDSRRADVEGYLEFIWVQNGAKHPQAVAMITDVCHPKAFAASYGTWTCQGDTVAEVKQQLFSQIEENLTACAK
jgi:hypothetical protein